MSNTDVSTVKKDFFALNPNEPFLSILWRKRRMQIYLCFIIFEKGVLQSFREKLSPVPARSLTLPYTDAEEEWFGQLQSHYDEAFRWVKTYLDAVQLSCGSEV